MAAAALPTVAAEPEPVTAPEKDRPLFAFGGHTAGLPCREHELPGGWGKIGWD